jgi:septin family protein
VSDVCNVDKFEKNVKITAKTVEIEERGVKLRLTVVDTPGFGDAIDNTDRYGKAQSHVVLILI